MGLCDVNFARCPNCGCRVDVDTAGNVRCSRCGYRAERDMATLKWVEHYPENPYGHIVTYAESKLSSPCIVCGEPVELTEVEARGVCVKVCEECKEAIKFAKKLKSGLSSEYYKGD